MKKIIIYIVLFEILIFHTVCNASYPLVKDIEYKMLQENDHDQFLLAEAKISGNDAYRISMNYALGIKVSQNLKKSLKWLIYAAEHDCKEAQFKLGLIYFQGIGLSVNTELGFYWINLSAHNHYPEGEYYLGYMYENAIGTKKNNFLAHYWKNKGKLDGACKGGEKLKDNLICLSG